MIKISPKKYGPRLSHYFHFMFGYFMPAVYLIKNTQDVFVFCDCGPLNRHIKNTFPNSIIVKPNTFKNNKKLRQLYGNFSEIILPSWDIDEIDKGLEEHCFTELKKTANKFLLNNKEEENIIFISRGLNPLYKLSNHKSFSTTNGCERRSIKNIDELLKKIKLSFPEENVYKKILDNKTIKEQASIFNQAKIVIAQHGAALSNIIFCKKGTLIIEIGKLQNLERPWFSEIAKKFELKRETINIEDDYNHIQVPLKAIKNIIKQNI